MIIAVAAASAWFPPAALVAAGDPDATYLSGVSCPSTTFCMGVGTITTKMLSMRWDGAHWSRINVPKPAGEQFALLASVACPSDTSCFAVGTAGAGALVEHWDGNRWSIVPSPSPSHSPVAALAAVTCPSTTSCYAVGSAGTNRGRASLIEHWDGTRWKIVAGPNVPGATYVFLTGVSCASPVNCVAIGSALATSDISAVIEHWDGTRWSIDPTPAFAGQAYPELQSVACPTVASCFAVGYVSTRYGIRATKRLVERWNGTRWSLVSFPTPKYPSSYDRLLGVSCTAPSSCTAVGSHTHVSTTTLVERWNGSRWTIVPSPNPATSAYAEFNGISCPSATSCVAAGFHSAVSPPSKPLAEQWDGQHWSITLAPNPS